MVVHPTPEKEEAMTQRRICALLFGALAFAPAQGVANDTSAELATGGLIFKKSQDIEMRSQDLFISMKEIRIYPDSIGQRKMACLGKKKRFFWRHDSRRLS
jgi:hypothetical protein